MPTGGRGRFPWEGHLGATSREKPLPQKRVVLSRTLRTAAPLSGCVRLSHFEKPGHTAYAFPPCSVRYRPTSKKGRS